jgi:hypothetical protein
MGTRRGLIRRTHAAARVPRAAVLRSATTQCYDRALNLAARRTSAKGPSRRGLALAVMEARMPLIRMTDAPYTALARLAIGTFRQTGQRQADGTWLVPIEQDTWDALQATRLPGETDEDVIQRVIHHHLGRRPS